MTAPQSAGQPLAAGVPMFSVNDPQMAIECARTIRDFIAPRIFAGGPGLLDLLSGTALCVFDEEPDTVYFELRDPAEDEHGRPRTAIRVIVCRLRGHRWFDPAAGAWQVPARIDHAEAFTFSGLLRETPSAS